MSVAVVGCGAIGATLAYRLSRHYRVLVIVRNAQRREEVCSRGIEILDLDGSRALFRPMAIAIDELDKDALIDTKLVFVAVKAYDVENVFTVLARVLPSETCIVTLQNGFGIHERALEIFGDRAIHGVVTFGAYRKDLNTVIVTSPGYIALGSKRSSKCVALAYEVLKDSGIDVRIVDDIDGWIWMKLLVNAAINPLTAIMKVRNREVVENPHLFTIAREVVMEGMRVAEAYGVKLPMNPLDVLKDIAKLTGDNISSMLQDVMFCRSTEIEYINGAIVRLGERFGIPTPMNRALYSMIKYLESICRS